MQRFSGVKVYDKRGDKWCDVTLCAFAAAEQEDEEGDREDNVAGRATRGCVLELMDAHGVLVMKYLMGSLRVAQAEHRSLHADPTNTSTVTTTATTTTASSSASTSCVQDGSRPCSGHAGVAPHGGSSRPALTSQAAHALSSSAGNVEAASASATAANSAAVRAELGTSAPSSLASSLMRRPGRLSRPSSSDEDNNDGRDEEDEEDEQTMYCVERHGSVAGPAQRAPPRQGRRASHDTRTHCFRLVVRTVTPRAARVPLAAALRRRLGLMTAAAQRPAYSSHSVPRMLYPMATIAREQQQQERQSRVLRHTAETTTSEMRCEAEAARRAEEGEAQTGAAKPRAAARRCATMRAEMPQAVSLCDAMHRPWQQGYTHRAQAHVATNNNNNKDSNSTTSHGCRTRGGGVGEEQAVSYAPFALPQSMPEPWCMAAREAQQQQQEEGAAAVVMMRRNETLQGRRQVTAMVNEGNNNNNSSGAGGTRGGACAQRGLPPRGAYNFLAPLTCVEELYDVMLYGELSEPVSPAAAAARHRRHSQATSHGSSEAGECVTALAAGDEAKRKDKAAQKGSSGAASRATFASLSSSSHVLQDLLRLFHLPHRPSRALRAKSGNNDSSNSNNNKFKTSAQAATRGGAPSPAAQAPTRMAVSANASTTTTASSTLPSPSSLHRCEKRSSSASTTQTCPSQPAVEVYLTLRFDGEPTLRRFLRECVQRMMPPRDIDPYVEARSDSESVASSSSSTTSRAELRAMQGNTDGAAAAASVAHCNSADDDDAGRARTLRPARLLQREVTRMQTLQSSYTRRDGNRNARQSWTEYFCYDIVPTRQPRRHAAQQEGRKHRTLPSAAKSLQCAEVPVYLWYAWRREAEKAYASCERGLLVIEAAVHGADTLLQQQQQQQHDEHEPCVSASERQALLQPGNATQGSYGSAAASLLGERRECTMQRLCAAVGRGGGAAKSSNNNNKSNDEDDEKQDEEERGRYAAALSLPLFLPGSLHRAGDAMALPQGEEEDDARSEETVRVVLQEASYTRPARRRGLLVPQQPQYIAPQCESYGTRSNLDSYHDTNDDNNNSGHAGNDDDDDDGAVYGVQRTVGPLLRPSLHGGAHFDDAFLCLTDTHLLFMNSFAEAMLHLTLDEVALLVHSPTASPAARTCAASNSGSVSSTTKAAARREGKSDDNNNKASGTSSGGNNAGCAEAHPKQQQQRCLPFVSLLTRPGSNEGDEPALLITFVLLPTIPSSLQPPTPIAAATSTTATAGQRKAAAKEDNTSAAAAAVAGSRSVGGDMGRSPPVAHAERMARQPREGHTAPNAPGLATQHRTSAAEQRNDSALDERLELLLGRLTSRLPGVPCVTCRAAASASATADVQVREGRPRRVDTAEACAAAAAAATSGVAGQKGRAVYSAEEAQCGAAHSAYLSASDTPRVLPDFLPPCLRRPRRCAYDNVGDVELLWRLNARPLPHYPILRADLYRAAHAIPHLLSDDSCSSALSSSSSSSSVSLLPPADTGQVAHASRPCCDAPRKTRQGAGNTTRETAAASMPARAPVEDEYAMITPRRQRTMLIRRALFW